MSTDDGTAEQTRTAEHAFGESVKTLRSALGMSQEALAAEMSRRGFKWHQATVYKAESGSRQTQLGEALALADIFRVPLERMAGETAVVLAISKLREEVRRLRESDAALYRAAVEYEYLREKASSVFYDLDPSAVAILSEEEVAEIEQFRYTTASDVAAQDRTPEDF